MMKKSNQTYAITELAMLYFETSDGKNARRRLMRNMQQDRMMWEELLEARFQMRQRFFTPRQYEVVVRYMGEPLW